LIKFLSEGFDYVKVAKMRWIKSSTKNSYFRDEINPGPCEVLSKEVRQERQMKRGQRRLAMLEVRERFQNTKSWLNFTPKPAGLLQEEF
jgi:hypothetical protein